MVRAAVEALARAVPCLGAIAIDASPLATSAARGCTRVTDVTRHIAAGRASSLPPLDLSSFATGAACSLGAGMTI
jgi:hypothetical protein